MPENRTTLSNRSNASPPRSIDDARLLVMSRSARILGAQAPTATRSTLFDIFVSATTSVRRPSDRRSTQRKSGTLRRARRALAATADPQPPKTSAAPTRPCATPRAAKPKPLKPTGRSRSSATSFIARTFYQHNRTDARMRATSPAEPTVPSRVPSQYHARKQGWPAFGGLS